ncbi:Hypothetical predicted protein [Olea europaea subsp. europaea]|uniref:Uncharacterized protein n=2 Tax=Olea europaea subsp. europaea TaxID=158383 RepID=A0A8S0U5K4_OLEEU|nr:Hypothetical predicted protein [Olea europaea subsp. europaea]
MVPPASLFFSSIDTISGSQIPIYQIMITSVSNYTSMSSLVPIGCHCYGGTQVMKNSSSFLSPLKCPMVSTFYRMHLMGSFVKVIDINLMMEKEKNEGRNGFLFLR